jgi:hypothetical protein
MFFSCRWGVRHRKIDDLSICPPNIILKLNPLLVIPNPDYIFLEEHFSCEFVYI